jgi:hypothetical protein
VIQEWARGWREEAKSLLLVKETPRSDADSEVRKTAIQELKWRWRHDAEAIADDSIAPE